MYSIRHTIISNSCLTRSRPLAPSAMAGLHSASWFGTSDAASSRSTLLAEHDLFQKNRHPPPIRSGQVFSRSCFRTVAAFSVVFLPLNPCCLSSILHGEAGDFVAFEVAARRLGAVLVETGKAGTVKGLAALDHALGEPVGAREEPLADGLRRLQMLACFVLVREGADLDHPAGTRLHVGGGHRHVFCRW